MAVVGSGRESPKTPLKCFQAGWVSERFSQALSLELLKDPETDLGWYRSASCYPLNARDPLCRSHPSLPIDWRVGVRRGDWKLGYLSRSQPGSEQSVLVYDPHPWGNSDCSSLHVICEGQSFEAWRKLKPCQQLGSGMLSWSPPGAHVTDCSYKYQRGLRPRQKSAARRQRVSEWAWGQRQGLRFHLV